MPEANERLLILTSFAGYGIPALRPFVDSWRANCPAHDVHAVVEDITPATANWLEAHGVRLHFCPLPRFSRPAGARKALEKMRLRFGCRALDLLDRATGSPDRARGLRRRLALLDLSALRFDHYARILAHLGPRYAHVALLDGRDSVFQRPLDPVAGIHAFAEHDLIGQSHFARRWFQMTYGAARWRELRNHPFLCSGAIIGDTASIRSFLELERDHCARQIALSGEDQAVFNHLVHGGLVPARVHRLGDGQFINLNASPLDSLRIDDGVLCDSEGRPYSVVHQYDRVAGLAPRLRAVNLPAAP